VLNLNESQFHTGWFIESLLTELFVFLVLRTRRPFFRSRPGCWLLLSTILVGLITLTLPYIPFMQDVFGFVPLSPLLMLLLLVITGLYVVANEVTKKVFYRRTGY
jgi:Mg2+-importing ATPase